MSAPQPGSGRARSLYLRREGLRLHALDYRSVDRRSVDRGGEGLPPLLFLHGSGAHARWWDHIAPRFSDLFRAVALDLRGHGESERSKDYSLGA
ncbi:MAG: alpha/beta fold hydrolase, partial [Nitrospinota bacterium]